MPVGARAATSDTQLGKQVPPAPPWPPPRSRPPVRRRGNQRCRQRQTAWGVWLVRGVRGERAARERDTAAACVASPVASCRRRARQGGAPHPASHRGAGRVRALVRAARVYKRLALPLPRLQLQELRSEDDHAGRLRSRAGAWSSERTGTAMGKGRAPCCAKVGLNKGSWTPEEDMRLIAYIQKYGHANWRALPKQAGTFGRRRRAVTAWVPSA